MGAFGKYKIIEKIKEGEKRTIYRALNEEDKKYYVLKVLNSEYSHPMEIYKLKHEYEILNELDLEIVVQAFSVEIINKLHVLIEEDFGAISIKKYLEKFKVDVDTFLVVAEKIVTAMIYVHNKGIIHKDLNSTNILINPESLKLKISDFGLSDYYSDYNLENKVNNNLIGTIEYSAPEQTGRINKSIDFRSDIYSLGITFYELITGELPFESNDIMGLIHSHIAVIPITPCELIPEIPSQISNLIMKMIEKDPDLRYQSFIGVLEDLKKIIDQKNRNGVITNFELGKKEEHGRFLIPNSLFGRSDVVNKIYESINRIQHGSNEIVLIKGEFGSGKSYILNNIENMVNCNNINILYSNTEENYHNDTYFIFKVALKNYIENILGESEDEINNFRNSIYELAGPDIAFLMDRLPLIKEFLGEPEEKKPVNTFQSSSRLRNFICGLVGLVSSKDKPLVIVIDNLHKTNTSTVETLDYILNDDSIKNLLILSSFNEKDIVPTYLSDFIDNNSENPNFQIVSLDLFSLSDITQLIKNIFKTNQIEAEKISLIIEQRTQGNPYFVLEILKDAHKTKKIQYNLSDGLWEIDISKLEEYPIYTNVLSNLMNKIVNISDEASELLSLASCIGMNFDLQTLNEISDFTSEEIREKLTEILENELITSSDYKSKYLKFLFDESVIFKFVHENLREIFLENLTLEEQMEISYKIGMLGLRGYSDSKKVNVDIVEHLNFARIMMKDRDERIQLLKLNYDVAERAIEANSYRIASEFLTAALELIDNQLLDENYRLYFNLYLKKAETEYHNKNFDTAEFYFNHLLKMINNPLDVVLVYKIKMNLYVNQGKVDETLTLAKDGLKKLGMDFSIKPSKAMVVKELLLYKLNRKVKGPKDLEKLKVMVNEKNILIMDILMISISVSYLSSKELFIYTIMKMLNYSVKHGHGTSSPYAYAIYGLLEAVAFNKPQKGLEYGQIGIKIANEFGDFEVINKCNFTVGFFLNHWVNHSSENIKYLETAIQNGYYAGDMVFYTYSVAAYLLTLVETGENLDNILEDVEKYFVPIKSMKVDDVFNFLQAIRQYVLCLKLKTNSYTSFENEDFNQLDFEKKLKDSDMVSIYAIYQVFKVKICYLFGEYEEAFTISTELKPYFSELMGLMPYAHLKMYQSLALLKLVNKNPENRNKYLRIVKRNQKSMYKWMINSPNNFAHKYYLVEAELSRVVGMHYQAETYYLSAIKESQRNGYIHEEALGSELLSDYYVEVDKQRMRMVYIKDAYYLYSVWGAIAKKKYLKDKYPEIIFDDGFENKYSETHGSVSDSESSATKFDYLTIIKSSQALSAEIILEELLIKLIRIIIENAGADNIVLMIFKNILTIEAMGTSKENIKVFGDKKVNNSGLVPEKIVNYVMRTEKIFISNDIESDIKFRKDDYFESKLPKSILCIPIFNKGYIYGVLYLENSSIYGAFSKENVEVLNILTSQFAFSYENAQLYQNLTKSEGELKLHKENLETLVGKRTHELSYANIQIQNLLDNAGQGFLSFDRKGLISNEYSKECYKIFQFDIADELFGSLVGKYTSLSEQDLIERVLEKIFQSKNEFEANVYISLLPNEIIVGNRIIEIEYRFTEVLKDKKVMVILTDVTDKKELEIARENEKKNLKMIVKAVKYQSNFRKTLEDYYQFYTYGIFDMFKENVSVEYSMLELYRTIHTYKGEFAQWSMNNTENVLHEIESLIHMKLENDNFKYENAVEFIEEINFESIIEKDISIIKEYVGEAFLNSSEKLEIEKTKIIDLEKRLMSLTDLSELDEIVNDVKRSRFTNFMDMFQQFDEYLKNIALGLDKKINDILIEGEEILVDKSYYHGFFRTVNHVFRNMLDHGIEEPRVRLEAGKEELGHIVCKVEKINSDRLKLTLIDDGCGINTDRIKNTLLKKGILGKEEIMNLPESELIQYIFEDDISEKTEITKLSGRGLGLSALKKEVLKLGGEINVFSEKNVGTSFVIELPIFTDQ